MDFFRYLFTNRTQMHIISIPQIGNYCICSMAWIFFRIFQKKKTRKTFFLFHLLRATNQCYLTFALFSLFEHFSFFFLPNNRWFSRLIKCGSFYLLTIYTNNLKKNFFSFDIISGSNSTRLMNKYFFLYIYYIGKLLLYTGCRLSRRRCRLYLHREIMIHTFLCNIIIYRCVYL